MIRTGIAVTIAIAWALFSAQVDSAEPVLKIQRDGTFFSVLVMGEGIEELKSFSFSVEAETDKQKLKKIQFVPGKGVKLQEGTDGKIDGTMENIPSDNILMKLRLLDTKGKFIHATSSNFIRLVLKGTLLNGTTFEQEVSWTKSEYAGVSEETLLRFEKSVLLAFELEKEYIGEYVDGKKVGALEPWMLWAITEIESSFREGVIVQKKSKCLGSLQIQPSHFANYKKSDGSYYDPFNLLDSIRIAIRVLQDPANANATRGKLDRKIRMYNAGSEWLDTPVKDLPRKNSDLADYLNDFANNTSVAKKRMEKASELFTGELADMVAEAEKTVPKAITSVPSNVEVKRLKQALADREQQLSEKQQKLDTSADIRLGLEAKVARLIEAEESTENYQKKIKELEASLNASSEEKNRTNGRSPFGRPQFYRLGKD